jgi:VIT1/CCC1 family predicted Fe2+/Mn2+ transporter
MKLSIRKGFSFGLTSGVITTLGMIVGLHSSTHSALIIIGGILVIAIADASSDALGIHISEESEIKHTTKEIWEATITTFLSKFVFALTFITPILLFSLSTAIIISVIWGFSLITIFSLYLAKQQNIKPYRVVLEHVIIAAIVVVATHCLGDWIATFG